MSLEWTKFINAGQHVLRFDYINIGLHIYLRLAAFIWIGQHLLKLDNIYFDWTTSILIAQHLF